MPVRAQFWTTHKKTHTTACTYRAFKIILSLCVAQPVCAVCVYVNAAVAVVAATAAVPCVNSPHAARVSETNATSTTPNRKNTNASDFSSLFSWLGWRLLFVAFVGPMLGLLSKAWVCWVFACVCVCVLYGPFIGRVSE